MIVAACWLIAVLLLGLAWLVGTWQHRCPSQPGNSVGAAVIQRLLKPRTPDDCPACRAQAASPVIDPLSQVPVRPWCELKSRRGAPKRINTEGFACPIPTCAYYRITDARVHALVGDGVVMQM